MMQKKIKTDTDQRAFTMIYHDFYKSNLLDHYEKSIFIALKIFSDSSNQCYPSIKKLTEITGISKRKVQGTLKRLEQKHIISITSRTRADGGDTSNIYTLHDSAEMWKAGSMEELNKAVDEMEEKRMIEALTAKGYHISREKEPESLPASQSNNDSSTKINQYNNSSDTDNTAQMKKSQESEKYSLSQIEQLFDYDTMIQENPCYKQDIDSVMSILHTALNTAKPAIRISGQDMPAATVTAKLMKLEKKSIMYAIHKYQEQTERIKNPVAYMLTILYTVPEQCLLDMKNQKSHERA